MTIGGRFMLTEDEIDTIKSNIFHRSIDAIPNYQSFLWHTTTYKEITANLPKSSQAVVIDIWGCIALSPYRDKIINTLFNVDRENWEIIFEFRDKYNILHEYGKTSIDVALFSSDIGIFIESKFTETINDGCYYWRECKCNGDYCEDQTLLRKGKFKCTFNAQWFKGDSLSKDYIKYWDYIPKIYNLPYDEKGDIKPCPFKNQYQIMRNLCLSKAIELSPLYEKIKHTINYLAYFNSIKFDLYNKVLNNNYSEEIKKYLFDENSINFMHYNGLLNKKYGIIDLAKKVVENNINELNVFNELEIWINNKIEAV